jgi:septal ring factor EnvC (AmiA/AmiB activator)
MTTSSSPQVPPSRSPSSGVSGSSLPRWRLWLQTLNWRRDPEIESEIEQLRNESAQIEKESEQLRSENVQIESEIEQLRNENARLAELNAKIDAILFSSATSSSPPPSTPSKSET